MQLLTEIAKYTEQIQRLSADERGDSQQRAAAHLYYMRGRAYRLMCDANHALADLEEACRRVTPDDPHLRSLILLERGRIYGMVHDLQAAFSDVKTAVALLGELESTHPGRFRLDLAKSHRVLGWLYIFIGDFDRALQFLNSSVTLYEANPYVDEFKAGLAKALYLRGKAYIGVRDFEKSTSDLKRAQSILDELDRERWGHVTARIYLEQFHILGQLKKYEDALDVIHTACITLEALLSKGMLYDESVLAECLASRGMCLFLLGRPMEAKRECTRAQEIFDQLYAAGRLPDRFAPAVVPFVRGIIYLGTKQFKLATQCFSQGLVLAEQLNEDGTIIHGHEIMQLLLSRGTAHMGMKQWDQADKDFATAMELYERQMPRNKYVDHNEVAQLLLSRVQCSLMMRNLDDARRYFSDATALVRELSSTQRLKPYVGALYEALRKERRLSTRNENVLTDESLSDLIAHLGLSRVEAAIRASVRSSIRLIPNKGAAIDIGKSKIGGLPDMPPHWSFPARPDGSPLAFLAQIHLADLAPYREGTLLPQHGMLYFFYDANEQPWGYEPTDRTMWKVLYYDGDVSILEPCQAPAGLDEHCVFPACAVTFRQELTLPAELDVLLTEEEQERYMALCEAIQEIYAFEGVDEPIHRMFGYPDEIQEDVFAECEAVTRQRCRRSTVKKPRSATGDWRLLLQIDSDIEMDTTGMMWGDAGRLYFCIREEDIVNRKFDDVWVILQCY